MPRVADACGPIALATAALLVVAGEVAAWPFAPPPATLTSTAPDWGYRGEVGPPHWAELDAAYTPCAAGTLQSPIDLRPSTAAPGVAMSFAYRSSPLSLVNDGRLIWADDLAGSHLTVDGHRYELVRFQFHAPSEHRIDGRAAELEVQFLHRDAAGRLLIVAVLVEPGRRTNSMLRRIAEHLPPPGEAFYGGQVGINPLFLLPSAREHFAYPGSLTVPPCTEGIEWLVLRTPLVVDASVIARFQQALGANARPLQTAGRRPVVYRHR
ncbi:carbonic anhydrase [Thiococcus pfennigii]|jgi:carbonic anhydrase|uniref:carbonic anhydrase n=1 Tax=Thiococcus pfennigii TaxID=1057 RepID=UPI001903A176|nr:carbonic anhydrase family protein [Thiococcus pfennigii]